jgi:hypothetical protein
MQVFTAVKVLKDTEFRSFASPDKVGLSMRSQRGVQRFGRIADGCHALQNSHYTRTVVAGSRVNDQTWAMLGQQRECMLKKEHRVWGALEMLGTFQGLKFSLQACMTESNATMGMYKEHENRLNVNVHIFDGSCDRQNRQVWPLAKMLMEISFRLVTGPDCHVEERQERATGLQIITSG